MRFVIAVTLFFSAMNAPAWAGEAFTIRDAIEQAIKTNPGVSEVAASRRATDADLMQQQGTLLPQVKLRADWGPEMLKHDVVPAPLNNGVWMKGRSASVTIRQTLFDGFASINEIWRQAARVDSAAFRVQERTELIALDAAEAYIDVARYTRLVALAQENVAAHRKILATVQARFSGGRSGQGDLDQARERVASAEAALHQFRQSRDDARAKYRKVVGLEPYNLRSPGRLPGLPSNKDETLAIALKFNPTIRAAGADTKASKHAFHATAGAFMPQVSLEATALRGVDSVAYPGTRTEESLKIVSSWDIFNGFQDAAKRAGAADRMIETMSREARLQRDAFESIDKAWAARTITNDRIAALTRDVESARKVIVSYTKEYELGQRSLIDLLNAENTAFSSWVSLISARGVAVFADYQLLATMGKMLDYLRTEKPPESEPLNTAPFGLVPMNLPKVWILPPGPGPEPLNVGAAPVVEALPYMPEKKLTATSPFDGRWFPESGPSWLPKTQMPR